MYLDLCIDSYLFLLLLEPIDTISNLRLNDGLLLLTLDYYLGLSFRLRRFRESTAFNKSHGHAKRWSEPRGGP
jgi:hypothetical protein